MPTGLTRFRMAAVVPPIPIDDSGRRPGRAPAGARDAVGIAQSIRSSHTCRQEAGEARMRRREFAKLVATTVAWPIVANAQKPMPVIGFLSSRSPDESSALVTAFSQGLSETSYIEGHNVAIEYRWAEGRYERLPSLAADLVRRKVGVIFSTGGLPAALAAKGATLTIPIIFAMGGDPVGEGLVASLARPGGNITGVSFLVTELHRKRLELLSELVPEAKISPCS